MIWWILLSVWAAGTLYGLYWELVPRSTDQPRMFHRWQTILACCFWPLCLLFIAVVKLIYFIRLLALKYLQPKEGTYSLDEIMEQVQAFEGVAIQINFPPEIEASRFRMKYTEFFTRPVDDDATAAELTLRVQLFLETQRIA